MQATEAVKILLGIGDRLVGRLLTYDALGMRFREVKLRRDPHCPLCGTSPTIKDLSIHSVSADAPARSSKRSIRAPREPATIAHAVAAWHAVPLSTFVRVVVSLVTSATPSIT